MRRLVILVLVALACGLVWACGGEPETTLWDVQIIVDGQGGDTAGLADMAAVDSTGRDISTADVKAGTDEEAGQDDGTGGDDVHVADESGTDVAIPRDESVRDEIASDDLGSGDDSVTGGDESVGPDENGPSDDGSPTDVPQEDIVVTSCGPETDYGSCRTYWACYDRCPAEGTTAGDACVSACQANLSAAGLEDVEAFNGCLYGTCGFAATEQAWYACVQANCQEEIIGCYWGCTYATCADMWACSDQCPDDDPATTGVDEWAECDTMCASETSQVGQMSELGGRTCALAECPVCLDATTEAEKTECSDCYQDAVYGSCWDEYRTCFAGGDDYATCNAFGTCLTECSYVSTTQAAYDTCVSLCQEGASPDAMRDRIVAEDCSMDACPACLIEEPTVAEAEECDECWSSSIYGSGGASGVCDAQWSVCAGTQYATCVEFVDCAGGCEDGACQAQCRGGTTLLGLGQYTAAYDCTMAACPVCETYTTAEEEAQCDDCWALSQADSCATEWALCYPVGTAGCSDLDACINACETDECVDVCWADGDAMARYLHNAFIGCLYDACPTFNQTCINNALKSNGTCRPAMDACMAD